MAEQKKYQLKNLLSFLFSLFIFGCASQIPPGGGEIDKTPPQIIEVFPKDGTINYDDDFFELQFSEYVDKRSVKDAIFISPSIESSLELNWSGKSVEIKFPKKLKKDITYNITIGTDVVDINNRNRMAQAFSFSFSTGNKIDKGIIEGNIFSDNESGILIFAYKVNSDSINPAKFKPDYISQSGNKGYFKLNGLADGGYRVFAVKDEYKDLTFQSSQDLIGVPFKDVMINAKDTLIKNLNFYLFKIDTIKPNILSCLMPDKNHLLANFSEELDSSSINPNNYFLYDSIKNKKLNLSAAFKSKNKNTELVFSISDSMKNKDWDSISSEQIYLFCNNIKDKYLNTNEFDYTSVTVSDRPDTTAPKLYKEEPAIGSDKVDFNEPEILFYFDDSFDFSSLQKTFSVADTNKNKVKFSSFKIDDASFKIKILEKLKPQEMYLIKYDLNNIKDESGNFLDSIYQYHFVTLSDLNFTGLSGRIFNLDSTKNLILVLERVDDKNNPYKQKIEKDGKFNFERILPGKFKLWYFYDSNNDGEFSKGFPFPFVPSEKFKYFDDIIQLPPRWAVTDLEWDISD